jgi:DNA-binding XRE family transcriptional regulator
VNKTSIFNCEANTSKPEIRYVPAIIAFLGYNPWPEGRNLSERLVRQRTSLGLSQAETARGLAVDPGTLARWERGEREPTGKFIRALRRPGPVRHRSRVGRIGRFAGWRRACRSPARTRYRCHASAANLADAHDWRGREAQHKVAPKAHRTYPGRWTITFSNPSINMFVPTTIVELGALMTGLDADPSVKVVLFQSANPDSFIAHLDVVKAAERPEALRSMLNCEWSGMRISSSLV